MAMSYWEFKSEALDAVGRVTDKVRFHGLDPMDAITLIDQIATEPDLVYKDGNRLDDDEARDELAKHYGEPRSFSWEAR
jgi:hypothetical protein